MLLTDYFAQFRRGFWIGMGSEKAWNEPGFDVARDDSTQVILRAGHPIFNPYRQYEDWPKDPSEWPETYHFMHTPVIGNYLGQLIQVCCRIYEVWENIRQMRQRLYLYPPGEIKAESELARRVVSRFQLLSPPPIQAPHHQSKQKVRATINKNSLRPDGKVEFESR